MGLLNPRNLAYLASLAVLVAIYLRARAKPTLEVSSLMLFDEIAAPVASSRVLRTDLMFWLEMAALGALSMALAGLYIRTPKPAAPHHARALVFYLGPGVGARESSRPRPERARRPALGNLAARPQHSAIALDLAGPTLLSTPIVLEPRGQPVLPFGPLKQGGLVQARIVTDDALAADNSRWAFAPNDKPETALVMSPSPEARDDLARVLLAVNQSLIVTAIDPVKFDLAKAPRYRIAVLNDADDPGINAAARLIIYPPPWLERTAPPSWQLPVTGTVAVAEMQERADGEQRSQPLGLSPARILSLPAGRDGLGPCAGAGGVGC